MEMQGYYGGGHGGGGGDGDWYHQMAAFTALPFCPSSSSSSSSSPSLLMSEHSMLPPIAATLPGDDPPVDCSFALVPREEEISTAYLPTIAAPAVAEDLHGYPLDTLPPFPADLSTAGFDDELLMQPFGFSDIDLEVFGDVVAEEPKAEPLDMTAVVEMDHYLGSLQPRSMETAVNHGATGVHVHDHQSNPNVIVVTGYETAVGFAEKQQQARPVARCARRSGDGSGAAAGGKSLDHIGFEELRKYFYMPITKAAREINVGLTVLKKRCRELGVARWPHRKMKSLRSLILNIQEMGMPSAEVRRELEALERYCARMEENPAIELTEQTKKLRQACFKENYKRRREAAAVDTIDHCYNEFGLQQLPLPQKISCPSQSSAFFGY